MIVTCSRPVILPDEIRFYYSAFEGGHEDDISPAAIGLAQMRRDGFCCLRAGEQPGTLITHPMPVAGPTLTVNARTQEGGSVRVEALDSDSQPVPGLSGNEAATLSGDNVVFRASFGDENALAGLRDEPVRLKFTLVMADLFAFGFE